MSFVAAAVGGGALLGLGSAYLQSQATKDAANTQAAAAGQAAGLQYDEFLRQEGRQQPWVDAGVAALPQLQNIASQKPEFTQQDFLNNQDPAYQFDLQQGQQAIERSAAARGGLQNAGTLKDLSNYSQGMASNEYSNAYNRFMNNQNIQFSRLSSLAGIGQTANSAIGTAGANMANNVGNITMSNANAQAAATMSNGQIWGKTLSGLGNLGMEGAMLSRLGSPTPLDPGMPTGGYPSAGTSGGGGYSLGVDYSGLTAGV